MIFAAGIGLGVLIAAIPFMILGGLVALWVAGAYGSDAADFRQSVDSGA